jgi:hypothetical protein
MHAVYFTLISLLKQTLITLSVAYDNIFNIIIWVVINGVCLGSCIFLTLTYRNYK